MIYLDHNATTPVHERVFDAMVPYLRERWGNASSFCQLGREARTAVERAREKVAAGIGALPGQIVFTAGGTESDNLAIRGVAHAMRGHGEHLITSVAEHHAVLRTCEDLARQGFAVTFLPVDRQGVVDPGELRRSIRPDTILITVMAANNETGAVQPLSEISACAREHGILFHADAVQAVGKMEVDVDELGVDLLSLSAHKIYGPKGVGALYVREGAPVAPLMTGGHHEQGLRPGTENVAGIVGLGEALEIAVDTVESTAAHVGALRARLESRVLARVEDVRVHSDGANRVANTSNMSFQAVDGESILLHLDLRGICAATGSACTMDSPEPSHVLLAMGLEPRIAQGAVRFSLGRENNEEEIDTTVEALSEIIGTLRAITSVS